MVWYTPQNQSGDPQQPRCARAAKATYVCRLTRAKSNSLGVGYPLEASDQARLRDCVDDPRRLKKYIQQQATFAFVTLMRLTVPRRSVFKTGESRRIFFLTDAPLNPTTTNLFRLAACVQRVHQHVRVRVKQDAGSARGNTERGVWQRRTGEEGGDG